MKPPSQGVDRNELLTFLANELHIASIKDYCPNGLQIAGRSAIKTIVSGVTASLALIEAAVVKQADTILVHHGYFWRGEDPCIVGTKYHRIKKIMDAHLNLLAYHLPLDIHPVWGNNACLAKRLGLVCSGTFADQGVACYGYFVDESIKTVGELVVRVTEQLGRKPLLIGDEQQPIGRIAWCTGAAQHFFGEAITLGATVYLSGEISEHTVHLARESGVAYLACGHHATERYGVATLGDALATHFGLAHHFVDIDNPV